MSLITRRLAASACLVSLLGTLPLAQARSKSGEDKPRKARGGGTRGTRLKPAPKTTYANGDTPAERQRHEDARLMRECRGRPNAGACMGYAN
ncbi:MAG: hypothetical protein JSS17_09350 [Proteobacteria bacterium]|nr:hypothetical protein [Pseudomonadota bacterium]